MTDPPVAWKTNSLSSLATHTCTHLPPWELLSQAFTLYARAIHKSADFVTRFSLKIANVNMFSFRSMAGRF